MDFADYPGLNGELAADFHARHFMRRDTHVYDPSQMPHLPPYNAAALAGLAVDVKPRLTKEQHDVLESEFQKQSKPNTNTKKRFAEVLGVSLDKVNNWFQNRRAKSKQDAKKQAGAFNLLQHQQPNFPPQMSSMNNNMNPGNVSPSYCGPEAFTGMRDSAINMDGPMSNGLGISQNMLAQDFNMDHMNQMHSIPMQQQHSQQQHHSMDSDNQDDQNNRRTLTQDQFTAFGNADSFDPTQQDQGDHMSATITNPADIYGGYDFPDLCNFNFDNDASDPITSTPMQPSLSTDSYVSNAASQSDNIAPQSLQNASARSSSGTPSLSITPAHQDSNPFDFQQSSQSSHPISSQPASTAQWQPGQSIPVDIATLQQEFQDAAMRGRTQSVPAVPPIPAHFLEQPLAYPNDEAYPRRESSTNHLTRSMQNFSMTAQRSAAPSTSIAARRQRPRPAPLGGASLRSTSYHGQMPISPGTVNNGHSLPAGKSLRKIKSSSTMNGFASGRIQKNSVGSAQRSPSGVAFADTSAAVNRYARRVSSFAQASSAGLAPPTPLSPTSYANLRQASISDSDDNNMNNLLPASNFSPPTTPIYAANFARARLGSIANAENTPPQSAPASQQCFSNSNFPQTAAHMQSPMSSVPVLQSQPPHGFVPIMSNEFPQMPNAVFPGQQQPLQGQYMDMPMSYIMTNTGEVHMGYSIMPPFAQPQMHQQLTPPHAQHPFVPSSSSSPGTMVSSQVPKHSTPAADFFVHEYTPPQDVKQLTTTPRKPVETGPKNYTFSNHGPEYFEKNVKKHQEGSSPASSIDDTITA